MTDLTIIGIPQSTYVRSIRMLCLEKGIEHIHEPAMPHSDAVTAINPFGRVPVMRHGDFKLAESEAIARYLEKSFPQGPAFLPTDPMAAASVDQWISRINTEYYRPCILDYLFGYIFPKTEDGQPDRARIDTALESVEKCLNLADKSIGAYGHLAREELSYADLALFPILFYLSQTPESSAMIADSNHLSGYMERIGERDSARATLPPPPPK
ncbi:glutathione S-transferase family protein [Aestuariispira insulae]|uniref:glutathione transferase n=1 Tax=Aestuariispira insulae TaxID=1461337 RepID=A0A3D9HRU2_9PROT|nr:glutathione S-transferase family protein [Aestuariispira insulae]RED52125.1 glutathione S-transferase [Aestuariispira insulae]